MAKISIIIPVYNSQQHLRKCLDSICGQTLRDIEIICVNDCSSDDSLSILQEYAKNDRRVKLVDFKKNKGAAAARNTGIKDSCGEYLGFVDSDDFIDQDFYERLYGRAIESNSEVVKGNFRIYCPKVEAVTKDSWIDINENVKRHQANFCFSFTSAIFRADFVKKHEIEFLEGLIHFEDPYFTIKAALFYKKLQVIDDVFYYYVNNLDSASRKKFTVDHVNSLIDGVGKVLDLLDEHCFDKDHYIIVFNFLLRQVLECCDRINVGDEVNVRAADGLWLLFDRCKYREECATHHFLQKKKSRKEDVFKQLRYKVKNELKNA